MTFVRLHLPVAEVVNCIQLRLYKPRDATNIGLSQIRILGTSAFGGSIKAPIDLSEDDSHCKFSLGWLRLLHHCFTLSTNEDLKKQVVASAAQRTDLLTTCCGLLLIPTHIPMLYLPNLERVLCDLSLHNKQSSLNAIKVLLESMPGINEPSSFNPGAGRLFLNSPGAQSACELLYEICNHQDSDTPYRVSAVLEWLLLTANQAINLRNTSNCNSAYILCVASILWSANQTEVTYDLSKMITLDLFNSVYTLCTIAESNTALKNSLDAVLCSFCYIKSDFFPLLLQKMGVLVPNLSTDHGASISDDRKDSESMTDDTKQTFENNSEWYERLIIKDLTRLNLSNEQLETIALVSRSPSSIQQLLDSGLPKLLNLAILDFCSSDELTSPMCQLEKVTSILKFFSDVSEEKVMRDWLGSQEGCTFWLPLLHFLCKRPFLDKSGLGTETSTQLEEVCVRFLSKCCLCHSNNQMLLAKVLCEVIAQQSNGITGFMRRLILQLLLENEKVPVSIQADETLYKTSNIMHPHLPLHPAFKMTRNKAFLYLGTNVTLAEILEQYISFSTNLKSDMTLLNKKDGGSKNETLMGFLSIAADSDLSMAAGVTAKDKRVKDVKNQLVSTPQLKKKRYTTSDSNTSIDIIEGRIIKCDMLPGQNLPLNLTLAQVLKMLEDQGSSVDWPCIHLNISQTKGKIKGKDILKFTYVFTFM